MQCKWQVEVDDYARKVLQKHWPEVPKWRDVRYFLGGKRWRRVRAAWHVDLVAGGFPCQDISNAGRRAGIDGKRSGLWSEFARIIRILRPRYVLIENVPALTVRGLGRVLSDLAASGFDAEWTVLSAAMFGTPHLRRRIFIVAYANNSWQLQPQGSLCTERERPSDSSSEDVAYANSDRRNARRTDNSEERQAGRESDRSIVDDDVSNSDIQGLEIRRSIGGNSREEQSSIKRGDSTHVSNAESRIFGQCWRECLTAYCERARDLHWPISESGIRLFPDGLSPTVGRVANRVDQLRFYGNAVVPQIITWIGERILHSERLLNGQTNQTSDVPV